MTFPLRRLLPLVALLLLAPRAHADAIDDYVSAEIQSHRVAGLSIAVVRAGKIEKTQGYGLANLELGVPASPATVYKIGGLADPIRCSLALALADSGKLRLDDPITRYIAGVPAAWSHVTVRELMDQTSGLPELTPLPPFGPALGHSKDTRYRLQFPPGTRFSPSAINSALLEKSVAKSTGKAYQNALQENIQRVVPMSATMRDDPLTIVPNRAAGYTRINDQRKNAPVFTTPSAPADGLLSTAADLARWTIALDGTLLKPETRQTLFGIAASAGPRYAAGWYVSHSGGRRVYTATGQAPGFCAAIARFMDDDLTVIVLSNDETAPLPEIVRGIAGHYVSSLAAYAEIPILDSQPEVTAKLRKVFNDLAIATGDPTLYTPDAWRVLQAGFQNNTAYRSLGKLESLDLMETHYFPDEGLHTYRYRLGYPQKTLTADLAINRVGKISALSIRPE